MPCNTIQTATVELGKVNTDLLRIALEGIGISNYQFQNGVLTIQGRTLPRDLEMKVKQSYSRQVVMTQAKKFGWQLKEVKPFQYQITKR